jgi:hypothetical protein
MIKAYYRKREDLGPRSWEFLSAWVQFQKPPKDVVLSENIVKINDSESVAQIIEWMDGKYSLDLPTSFHKQLDSGLLSVNRGDLEAYLK